MERRIGFKGLKKREGWLYAFPLFFCLSAATQFSDAAARSPIINEQSEFSNKSAVFFQYAPAPIALRSLEETPSGEEVQKVNIVIPQTPPVQLNRRNISIPFPASSYDAGGVISKGLLYSDDHGENWHEYGAPRPAAEGDNFQFSAPKDGEYWFALHLVHQDGTDTASRAQKFLIDTGSGIASASPAENGGDRMAQELLNLTQSRSAIQQTSADGSDALTSRLDEMGSAAQPADPFSPSANSTAEIPYPGKIRWIQRGTSKGEPALSITWFRPSECGQPESEGKVSIERAPTPDGPWTPVTPEAAELNLNGSGYWFSSDGSDSQPFYLRTVSTVNTDGNETSWVDTLPQTVSFAPAAEKTQTADFSTPPSREGGEIKAWSDSEPGEERKLAGRDTRDSVVDKTASVNQSASAPSSDQAAREAVRESRSAAHPQLTDPQQFSVNPIFQFGLGVFTGKDRNGNPLPDYSNAGSAPAYANQQQTQAPSLPSPPPKRPIWMSKQEYEEHMRAYEYELQQAKYAQAQREQMERLQKEQQMTAPGGIPGGYQTTITDSSGKEIRITEGSMVWDDGKGNLSTTPFPGQMNSQMVMPEMTFPDQPFQNVSQPMPVDSGYMSGAQPIPNNGAVFGEPYTPQEQALSENAVGNSYNTSNMSDLPNQSLMQGDLPPRPDQQQ